jgi:predicted outer membrane protein
MRAPRITGFSLLLALMACGRDEVAPSSGTTSAGLGRASTQGSEVAQGSGMQQQPAVAPGSDEPVATEAGAEDRGHGTAPLPGRPSLVDRNSTAPLNDDQILQVVHQAHLGQVQQAQIARAKSRDGRVQKLAVAILRDGAAAESRGDALAKRVPLKPESSAISEAVQNDESSATLALNATSGKDFDRSYVDAQVREREEVLDVLTAHLVPNARNQELTAYLQSVEAAMMEQLERAQALQRELEK